MFIKSSIIITKLYAISYFMEKMFYYIFIYYSNLIFY